MTAVISLTTDFGLADEYVGVMKGAILSIAPQAPIVDLTHAIADQDLQQTAYIIDNAHRSFPPGTIHVVVVDPGVGSERRIVLLAAHGQLFLAPDNGVLTLVLASAPSCQAFQVSRQAQGIDTCSTTFHGRDIFAPTAARLANGLTAEQVGPPCPVDRLVRLELPRPAISADGSRINGQVVYIDKFGNLMTNIDREQIARLQALRPDRPLKVRLGPTAIGGLHSYYAQVEVGAPLALIGSRGRLEISLNQGNAAAFFGSRRGAEVVLTF